jgi:hypothetical protein
MQTMCAAQAMILSKEFSRASGLLIAAVSMSSVGNIYLCLALPHSMLTVCNLTICFCHLKHSCVVLEVLSSNLGPEISYPDLSFPQIHPGTCA